MGFSKMDRFFVMNMMVFYFTRQQMYLRKIKGLLSDNYIVAMTLSIIRNKAQEVIECFILHIYDTC